MIGIAAAAVLLGAAVLVGAPSPRRRLPMLHRRRARTLRPLPAALLAVALMALLAPPAVVLVCVGCAVMIVMRARRQRRYRRRRRESQAMADALEILVGELRIGAHPLSALDIAVGESRGSLSESLRAVASRGHLGADIAEGMRLVASESVVPDYWNRLAVFWDLAVRHGLAMSDLMRAAHRDILDRQRFADRMRAAVAGARATAAILAGLPALGVLLGQLIGAQPIRFLLGGGLGGAVLVVGVALICIGVLWADHIIDRLMA